MTYIQKIQNELSGDKIIWLIVFLLGIFSILAVYSAMGSKAYTARAGDSSYYLWQQIVFVGLGFVVTYVCSELHYMKYAKLAPILLLISIPLLAYTMFFGNEINEAKRWLTLPFINKSIQVSDIAKVGLILYVSRSLAIKQEFIKDFNTAFLPVLLPIIVVCGLIAPFDLSSAALLFVTCLIMMFIGRVSIKYIMLLVLAGMLLLASIVAIGSMDRFQSSSRVGTWKERISFFIGDEQVRNANKEYTHQIENAKAAIAHGGLFGVGPGNSVQRNYLPVAYADFIYAIICEEYGLIGGVTVLMLFLWFLFRCIRMVTQCPKAFGAILAIGLCLNIVLQAFTNIAVSVELLPMTGLNLPMVSHGGTSMVFTCMSMGVILSISKFVEKAQAEKLALEKIEQENAIGI